MSIHMQVVGAAHTRKLFEKSLIKNFTKVVFCLASCTNFCLAETCVRCAGQDDDPHSGSRGIFARVKPGKHSPVLRDEKKLPNLLPGAQRNLSQASHRQSNRQTKQGNNLQLRYSKAKPPNRTVI
jgi:hypothetical protein